MSEDTLLEFPCEFPIKIMGEAQDDFAQRMVAIVRHHVPDYDAATVEMRPSKTGRYLSLTCTIHAVAREQLDSLYRELSSHPQVKIVL